MALVTCPGCLERDERVRAPFQRAADLEARVRDLEAPLREALARLGTNATNSSVPPSANPPQAPKPVAQRPTGKSSGAQPGHPAHRKRLLPPERLSRAAPFVPERCPRCQEPLPQDPGPDDPEPTWHQVAERPALAAEVTEYHGHFRTCRCCGTLHHAPVPSDLKAHGIGPRLAAPLAYLTGRHHVSRRGLEEMAEDVFEVPLSVGTVANLQAQVRTALAPAHAGAPEAVRAAPVKDVDETSWKQAGRLCRLWVAATGTGAAFLIHAKRGWVALAALLGARVGGVIGSDRWSAYGRLAPYGRPVCWAHLEGDFQKLVDRGGAAARLGRELQRVAERVFEGWHLFRGGTLGRRARQHHWDAGARARERLLRVGRRRADPRAAAFGENLLALAPAPWRFVMTEGVEPTPNHAERLPRRGVRWRTHAFGSHSGAGGRFVERLLAVVQTRRLQGRSVLRYLDEALVAHRRGLPAPSLLSTG